MSVGYAATIPGVADDPGHIAAGRHADIANLGNQRTGPGAALVTPKTITREDFLSATLPLSILLATKSDAIQRKWDRIIELATRKESLQTNASFALLIQTAVTDELLTTEQAAVFGKRTGSRFEVLFGPDTVVDAIEVAKALES